MRLLVSGGGTGGHIYPALALIRHLLKREPEAQVLYVGTESGLESKIVPVEGLPFETVTARGYQRRLRQILPVTGDLLRGIKEAGRIVDRFRPSVILGTGGYVAVPVVLAAIRRRLPVVIHEQNAIPGMANRYLSLLAARVCLSFEESRRHFPRRAPIVVTGNPRSSEVAAVSRVEGRRRLQLDPHSRVLVVYGGSRGALKLNQVMVEYIRAGWLPPAMELVYVTGEIYYREVAEQVGRLRQGVHLYPYLSDMPAALAAADLVVTRSGATTLAEITALGLPAILVPSPNVVNDHQYHNARLLADAGAALLLPEREFNPYRLRRELERLWSDPQRLDQMSRAGKKLGKVEAAQNLYDCLAGVARRLRINTPPECGA